MSEQRSTLRWLSVVAAAALTLSLAPGGCAQHHGALRHFRSGQCKPGKPLAGVYLPFRLHVVRRCITVSGIVDCVRREPDGDVHIRLRLARRYRHILTRANSVQVCAGRKGPAWNITIRHRRR